MIGVLLWFILNTFLLFQVWKRAFRRSIWNWHCSYNTECNTRIQITSHPVFNWNILEHCLVNILTICQSLNMFHSNYITLIISFVICYIENVFIIMIFGISLNLINLLSKFEVIWIRRKCSESIINWWDEETKLYKFHYFMSWRRYCIHFAKLSSIQ